MTVPVIYAVAAVVLACLMTSALRAQVYRWQRRRLVARRAGRARLGYGRAVLAVLAVLGGLCVASALAVLWCAYHAAATRRGDAFLYVVPAFVTLVAVAFLVAVVAELRRGV